MRDGRLSFAARGATDDGNAQRVGAPDARGDGGLAHHGQGEAMIDGPAKQGLSAPAFAHIPSETRHNVANTGTEPLEYVYVVAPVE